MRAFLLCVTVMTFLLLGREPEKKKEYKRPWYETNAKNDVWNNPENLKEIKKKYDI